jgi:general stress protein YciG
MGNTKEGWKKAQQTLLLRYGGPAGLKRHRQEIGRKGGLKSRGGGFVTMEKTKHHDASSKGGKSRWNRLDKHEDTVVS